MHYSVESATVVVDAGHIDAGKIVVTPAVPPVAGVSFRMALSGVGRRGVCLSAVVGADLEIALSRSVRVGDPVRWTSYGA